MTSAAFSFLVACVASAALTPLVTRLASARGLLDVAEGRLKVHERHVPRLGGIAIFLAFFVPIVAVFALDAGITAHFEGALPRLAAFVLGGVAIFALGLWDNLRGLAAPTKLVVEISVAIAVWAAGFQIQVLRLPFVGTYELETLSIVVTVLWIVGITNALNLVDGMDGLAAGVAFFAAVAHVVIGFMNGNHLLALFAAALGGAVLGFLPHNFHPARIFMGDSGSLFLGYVLAMTSIYDTGHKSSTAVVVLGPILILGLPILDTGLAVVRRTLSGAPVFDGDRGHVHHRLLALGLSQRQSVGLLYGLCAAFALAGLMATLSSDRPTALVIVSLLVILAVFERRLGFLRRARVPSVAGPLTPVGLVRDLRHAADPSQAWEMLVATAPALGIDRMRLTVPGGDERLWSRHPGRRPRDNAFRMRVRLVRGASDPDRAPLLEIEKQPFRRGLGVADELFAALVEECLSGPPRPDVRSGVAVGVTGGTA